MMAGFNRIFEGNKSKSRIHFIAIWPKKGKNALFLLNLRVSGLHWSTTHFCKIACVKKKTHFSLMHAGLNDLRTIQK